MSILIQINPSIESRIRTQAMTKGMELNQFISQFLENTFTDKSPQYPTVSDREALLLQQVNLDISSEDWELYLNLKEKRQQDAITKTERDTLISLIDDIEMANAKRIAVLAELSQIRNIPIRVLMQQLGLTPKQDE